LDLTPEETIEYSKLNSSVVVPSKQQLNPYYLGYKIFEDIEKRFGREYMFEVRELGSDQSFLRNYLTEELMEDSTSTLDVKYLERTLPYVHQLWGLTVHLETQETYRRFL
jgi:spore cortex formation protein SpoVR/YcgB (stage V sporulation)